MSGISSVKRLETVLEDFLVRAAESELERIETGKAVETLSDISRDSLKGRFVNNRLGSWFARHTESLDKKHFSSDRLGAIGGYLRDIKTGLDPEDVESGKLIEEINRWKKAGAEDMAYLHLAGSLIYYLKLSGFKVDPYIKRLKELEKREQKIRNGD